MDRHSRLTSAYESKAVALSGLRVFRNWPNADGRAFALNVLCRPWLCEKSSRNMISPHDSSGVIMKRFVVGADRGQSTLLPECLEWLLAPRSTAFVASCVFPLTADHGIAASPAVESCGMAAAAPEECPASPLSTRVNRTWPYHIPTTARGGRRSSRAV